MDIKKLWKGLTVAMIVTVLSVVVACAESSNRGGGPGGQQGPPPEAIKACEGKQEGDSVTFAGRNGDNLKSTCQTVENQLVAVPEGHNPPK